MAPGAPPRWRYCVSSIASASSTQAIEVAVLRLLDRLGVLDAGQRRELAGFATAPVTNRAGDPVGEIRIAADGRL